MSLSHLLVFLVGIIIGVGLSWWQMRAAIRQAIQQLNQTTHDLDRAVQRQPKEP